MVPADVNRSELADRNESKRGPSSRGTGHAVRPEFVDEAERPVVDAPPISAGTDHRSRRHYLRLDSE